MFRHLLFKNNKVYINFQILQRRNSMSTVPNKSTVAICHMRSTSDKNHNEQQVREIIRLSKERKAMVSHLLIPKFQNTVQYLQFVFLPECCDYVGADRTETIALAETLDGPTVNFYKQIAAENNVWLSIGGFHEITIPPGATSRPEKIHNAHLIINSCGELVEKYQKLHLYDVDTPEFKFRESNVVKGGDAIVAPLLTPIGSLGLMIVSFWVKSN